MLNFVKGLSIRVEMFMWFIFLNTVLKMHLWRHPEISTHHVTCPPWTPLQWTSVWWRDGRERALWREPELETQGWWETACTATEAIMMSWPVLLPRVMSGSVDLQQQGPVSCYSQKPSGHPWSGLSSEAIHVGVRGLRVCPAPRELNPPLAWAVLETQP